mmetsp:Transcript_7980/g.17997  ORF Transcript_7980/g.17997 Transcript_7980/m.17997 type:complete len:407 (-) Transcript_7980:179-1399(-)|eukprot:CAMPEP_0172303554 /NCGR_PEP_ID=MMETSP1058-20130122/5082_1 /TAXON_ID=83371 /ORGANISM="Detonula confervacea, Strain CCMP 353" /LENGTH=406 /DNA_ID=CAMNT_0013014419 /DNA_START=48 /DNA_END=1268 /DNA_ORIENTATION=-
MAAEAFDPFANDDDDKFLHDVTHPSSSRAPPTPNIVAPSRDSPRYSPRSSPRRNAASDPKLHDASNNTNYVRDNIQTDDFMKEFTSFSSMTLGSDATDQFDFPSNCFSDTFEHTAGADDSFTTDASSFKNVPIAGNLEGVTVVVAEEMSVIQKSQTNECSVKIRGNISLEAPSHAKPGQQVSCDVSFLDPKGHLDAVASRNYDCAQPTMDPTHATNSDTAFRISMPKVVDGQKDNSFGSPLIQYTCGDTLRPVPMLIHITIQELNDRCQIMFQLRVNPRNSNSLFNAAVLVSVPAEFDGEKAQVSIVGRSIGKGKIDTNWNGITRILSWKLGEFYSGAMCEIEALIPPNDTEPVLEMYGPTDTKFPVLLRYDSEGGLLSDVDFDFGEGSKNSPSIKRKFRVYHREI